MVSSIGSSTTHFNNFRSHHFILHFEHRACGFSDEKFQTTFDAIEKGVIPPSHCLVFWYSSLFSVQRALRTGIAVSASEGGIYFTLNRPKGLTDEEKSQFGSCEAFAVVSVPKRLLEDAGRGGKKMTGQGRLWRMGPEVLMALRSTVFIKGGTVSDTSLLEAGVVVLLPQCLLRAYQLKEDAISADFSVPPIVNISGLLLEDIAPAAAAPPNAITVTSSAEFLEAMASIRRKCAKHGFVPLYHYTVPAIRDLILQGGFRMSTQGQGDGGVYFSTMGPASYGLGTGEYESNIIVDCFGASRLDEYRGKHKLDLLFVYGAEPRALNQAPGGRDNAKVIIKRSFEDFSMPHEDGSYYLRPDRIMGCFLLDPSNLTEEVDFNPRLIADEARRDEETKAMLAEVAQWQVASDLELSKTMSPEGKLKQRVSQSRKKSQVQGGKVELTSIYETGTEEGGVWTQNCMLTSPVEDSDLEVL